jgi:trehalose-phosphatase
LKFGNKAELTQWARRARRLWMFLDYDGTLADFAPTPDHIEPDPALIRLLEDLVKRAATQVTILSGRRLGHVRQLLPVRGLFLAGTYGVELLTPEGETIHRVDHQEIRSPLEMTKHQWQQLLTGRKGFYLEDKGWAIALHARFAEESEAEQVLTQARQVVQKGPPANQFRILGGHKFLEIAPTLASKRETVSYLLERFPHPDARLLYIGDDDKDEEAFSAIHATGGAAIKVFQPSQASNPTEADFFFESPQEARSWLQSLL